MFRIKYFFFIFLLITLSIKSYSFELVRDVELEEFTKELLLPLTKTSNLKDGRIELYFIKSNQVNAFVTSGQNIFINTELIIQSETYDEYLGVLAHELAHINGGHISRTKEQISTLTEKSIPIYLLGILGILGGDTDAGLAALMVGSASVQDGYLYYSRTQEAAADQAAITLLCKSSQPPGGLESFLKKLDRSTINNAEEYRYKTTHPLTSDRFNWIKNSYKKYPNCKSKLNVSLQERFELIKAKLLAYTHNENEVIAIYDNKENQNSTYAYAVTNYFNGNHSKSIELIKSLIAKNSKNPYYHELLGEIYFSKGRFNLAIQEQKEAMKLATHENDLYLMMLGSYLLAEPNVNNILESIDVLNRSLFLNRYNSYAWYLLAKAYASSDNLSLAYYASAERYYLRRDMALALSFAKKAIKNIDKDTVEWYRTNDLLQLIVGIEEKDNKNRSKDTEK